MKRAWLPLLLIAMAGCDRSAPTAPPPGEAQPEVVAVDWLGRGELYAATVVGRREGLTGVEYADGDREWVEPSRLRAWPALGGRRLQVWMRSAAQDVTVIDVRGALVHVRFDDGADTWVGVEQLYALDATAPTTPTGPTAPASFPVRPPVEPARVRPGLRALTYWVNGGAVQRAQPWMAEILGVEGDRVRVRFASDGSEGEISIEHVLRVFDEPARPAVGERVWLSDGAPSGVVREQRADLYRVSVGEQARWVEADQILGAAAPVDPSRLREGALVTALWAQSSLYHATVVRVDGDQVTLAWHDGSTPSPVAIADVLEVWEPAQGR